MLPLERIHLPSDYGWFEHVVFSLDRWLRQRQGVLQYTDNPQCVFRIQLAKAETSALLRDGTRIAPGDAILNLHLWNEQFPAMGPDGATLGWARGVAKAIDLSLGELALYIRCTRDLDDVVALRANMRLGTREQSAQLARISSRYGFEAASSAADEHGSIQRLGENIFLALLVMASNRSALRSAVLKRDSTLVYLSRSYLVERYAYQSTAFERARGREGSGVASRRVIHHQR